MATIHVSKDDAIRDFAGLLAHVRLGTEIVIESETRAVAVVRPAVSAPGPGRLLSEVIAAAETRSSSAPLDGSFAGDLEEVINSHPEPLNPPALD
jgi:antitoxin (DNA-binding transcriptional repressor) of toxin-antitoxin stability system